MLKLVNLNTFQTNSWLNPNQAGVSESLTREGGQMAQWRKSAILAIFLHPKHLKSYQGTLGTQELPPTGSKTSHGPSLGLTGSFSEKLCLPFLKRFIFMFMVIVVLHQGSGNPHRILCTPKWTLELYASM